MSKSTFNCNTNKCTILNLNNNKYNFTFLHAHLNSNLNQVLLQFCISLKNNITYTGFSRLKLMRHRASSSFNQFWFSCILVSEHVSAFRKPLCIFWFSKYLIFHPKTTKKIKKNPPVAFHQRLSSRLFRIWSGFETSVEFVVAVVQTSLFVVKNSVVKYIDAHA